MLYIKEVMTEYEQINDQLNLYEQITSAEHPSECAIRAKNLFKLIQFLIDKAKKVQYY